MTIRQTFIAWIYLTLLATCGLRPIKRWLRRLISNHQRRRIRRKQSPWPVRQVGAVTLIFAPHQDDCALGCGGLITRRVSNLEHIHVAYITDGSGSHPGHPGVSPGQLAIMRADEARVATGVLGVPGTHLTFLHAPDGQLPHLSAAQRTALIESITTLIQQIGPAEIFITAAADGSTEHTAANALVRASVEMLSAQKPRILEYAIWSRWNPRFLPASIKRARHIYHLPLSPRELALKQSAIRSYLSQVEPLAPWNKPILSAEFLSYFQEPEEFFFEF